MSDMEMKVVASTNGVNIEDDVPVPTKSGTTTTSPNTSKVTSNVASKRRLDDERSSERIKKSSVSLL